VDSTTTTLNRQRALLLALGTALLLTYSHFVKFIPDGITGGILDGARNLAEGRGLVTHSINPAFLPYYKTLTLPLPYLWYPLVPWVTSWFFVVLGPHAWCLLILPVTAYFLSALLLHELGRRVFNATTGLTAAAALLCQPFMIETCLRENFTDPVLVCLTIGAVLAVFIARGRERTWGFAWLLLGGGLLGLAQYARSAATMLYVPMAYLVLTAWDRGRAARFASFFGSCLAVQAPIFWWNVQHVGTVTFTPTYVFLFLTGSFPGLRSFALILPTGLPEVLRLWGAEIGRKWLSQLWVHYKYFFTAASPLLLVGAALTFASPLTESQRVLRNFAAVLFATLAVFNSLIYWDNRYLLPVVPFVALLGAEFLRRSLAAAPPGRYARLPAVALIGALLAIEPLDFFYQSSKARSLELLTVQVNAERTQFIKDHLHPSDVAMAMDPGLIAWEAHATGVELPIDVATATVIHDRYVRFNAMILDAKRPRSDLFGYAEDWYRIASGAQTFAAFHPEASVTLSNGQTIVLLREASR
jgi:hypothetical protein